MTIPSHKIEFSDERKAWILASIGEILDSGQVILGEWTRWFEREFADACGRAYGIACSSDTAAFEMQLRALDVDGHQVLFPALGFPSILESIANAGGDPWLIDGTYEGQLFATPEMVQNAIIDCEESTGRVPKALILMHTGGLLAAYSEGICRVCEHYGVRVLEDAAHAFGATLGGKPAGSFGESSAFSLYATKPMHACEGGMIVTDDAETAERMRIMRNYGRTQDFGRSLIVERGNSWRITEIQSVIGLGNLQDMEENLLARRQAMHLYNSLTMEHPAWEGIEALPECPELQPNGYRYIRLLPKGFAGATTAEEHHSARQELKAVLKASYGIDLPGEVYELPAHKQPVWERRYEMLEFPFAEEFCSRHFCLPCYPSLTGPEQVYVVESVGSVVQHMQRGD